MNYQFAVDHKNYEDLSSGRVLFNQHGTTGFPVRLASEIFQRSKSLMAKKGNPGPYKIYDPCCGGGYLLAALGFLHHDDLDSITASDIDSRAVELAKKNLSLLSEDGMESRIDQLNNLYREYGKESHKAALESADRLRKIIKNDKIIQIDCFEADITKERPGNDQNYDLIITDLPYGQIVGWQTDTGNPVKELLDQVSAYLRRSSAIVVIVSTKDVSIQHENYVRIGNYKLGKRKITFLEMIKL